MNSFVEIWSVSGYCKFFFMLLLILFVVHLILLIYKSVMLCSKEPSRNVNQEEGVSVIITCSNKAELLQQNLESFLTQDYPCYEVIIVDECSEDETQDVLADIQSKYPHLKCSRIFPETKFRKTKKIAINLGIKAAQYDILLFSEINCRPISKNWIRTMQSYFDQNTAVVLGFANYDKEKSEGIHRYFRFLWFWKDILLNRHGINVAGNGYNMGYRKKYYLEKRGFVGNTQEYIGFDFEMARELSKKGSLKIVKDENSCILIDIENVKEWKDDCSYHYTCVREWPWYAKMWNIDFIVELLFYVLCGYYLIFTSYREVFIVLLLLIFLIDFIVINICLKHLRQNKLFLTSLIVNTVGFIYKWYYSIYSIFTGKKWR